MRLSKLFRKRRMRGKSKSAEQKLKERIMIATYFVLGTMSLGIVVWMLVV